jgi:hypothetical protein
MSPLLQQVLIEVDQLVPEEQWQVMNHLMTQLQSRATVTSKPTYSWELLEGAVPDLLGGQLKRVQELNVIVIKELEP